MTAVSKLVTDNHSRTWWAESKGWKGIIVRWRSYVVNTLEIDHLWKSYGKSSNRVFYITFLERLLDEIFYSKYLNVLYALFSNPGWKIMKILELRRRLLPQKIFWCKIFRLSIYVSTSRCVYEYKWLFNILMLASFFQLPLPLDLATHFISHQPAAKSSFSLPLTYIICTYVHIWYMRE